MRKYLAILLSSLPCFAFSASVWYTNTRSISPVGIGNCSETPVSGADFAIDRCLADITGCRIITFDPSPGIDAQTAHFNYYAHCTPRSGHFGPEHVIYVSATSHQPTGCILFPGETANLDVDLPANHEDGMVVNVLQTCQNYGNIAAYQHPYKSAQTHQCYQVDPDPGVSFTLNVLPIDSNVLNNTLSHCQLA